MTAKEVADLAMERETLSPRKCVLAARGQIDLYSAPTFKLAFVEAIDAGMKDIVVDLSGVDFMDSTGLGVLVGVSRRLGLLNGSLSIVSSDHTIRRIFEIAGLDTRFSFYDERSDALSNIR